MKTQPATFEVIGTLPIEKVIAWLDEDPPYVMSNTNNSQFVPVEICKKDLRTLDPFWSTENFKFQVITVIDSIYLSSSIELVVSYASKTRRLVGASTLEFKPGEIIDGLTASMENAEAICLSETLKNACKNLGNRFGSSLNRADDLDRLQPTGSYRERSARPSREAMFDKGRKPQPDESIMKQYRQALTDGDTNKVERLQSIYDIKIANNAS